MFPKTCLEAPQLQLIDLKTTNSDAVGKLNATDASQVLVLEDSPAGIQAGKAAGCKVLGLVTSHTVEQVVAAGPDWVVRDLSGVRVVGWTEERGTELEFVGCLRTT